MGLSHDNIEEEINVVMSYVNHDKNDKIDYNGFFFYNKSLKIIKNKFRICNGYNRSRKIFITRKAKGCIWYVWLTLKWYFNKKL